MACFKPLTAWRSRQGAVTFSRNAALDPTRPMKLPCGQCAGCRLEKSRQWALRCVHEAKQWEQNQYVTFTYSDENLPKDWSLQPQHMTKFWKRLRKTDAGKNIRYFMCGEYGDGRGRPHYHAIVFNLGLSDKKFYKVHNGNKLYTSKFIEDLWGYGYCPIGDVTFQSAAYVARYIMKKRTGDDADIYYHYIDPDGVVHDRMPEYVRMSRRPGIGKGWIDAYKGDVYPHDFVVVEGAKSRPPRYYDEQLTEEEKKSIKSERRRKAEKHADNNTPERLRVREQVALAKMRQNKRNKL